MRQNLTRRLPLLLACGAVAGVLAGCGGGTTTTVVVTTTAPHTSSSSSETKQSTSTSSTSTTPTGPQPCATSALALSLGTADAATSQLHYPLVFRNTGSSPCTLRGYPGVSYVSGEAGTQVGSPATRNPQVPVTTVTLPAGGTAVAALDVVQPLVFEPSTCKITSVRGLRIYPPGQTAAAFLTRPSKACSATSLPSSALSVTAIALHLEV
jgi:hypothetical protein